MNPCMRYVTRLTPVRRFHVSPVCLNANSTNDSSASTENASSKPKVFKSIPGNYNQLPESEKLAIKQQYQANLEKKLNNTVNRLRDTTGTMAGLGMFEDNKNGSLEQRRGDKRSESVMDRVARAMDYKKQRAEQARKAAAAGGASNSTNTTSSPSQTSTMNTTTTTSTTSTTSSSSSTQTNTQDTTSTDTNTTNTTTTTTTSTEKTPEEPKKGWFSRMFS